LDSSRVTHSASITQILAPLEGRPGSDLGQISVIKIYGLESFVLIEVDCVHSAKFRSFDGSNLELCTPMRFLSSLWPYGIFFVLDMFLAWTKHKRRFSSEDINYLTIPRLAEKFPYVIQLEFTISL